MAEGRGASRHEQASSDIQTKAKEGVTRQTSAKLDGMWGGGTSYPGKASDLMQAAAVGVVKPNGQGDPEAVRERRATDPRIVLKRQGLGSAGNGVEEKTLKTGKRRRR